MAENQAYRDRFHQGEWLKRSIAEQGDSVSAFARKTGLSRDAINKWFGQDHLQIRLDNAVRVLRALGYDVAKLMGGESSLKWAMDGLKPQSSTMQAITAVSSGEQIITRAMSPIKGRAAKTASPTPQAMKISEPFDGNVEPYSEVKVPHDIPLFEMSVAAGNWADVSEIAEVQRPGQIDHGMFRIHIAGDSMTPTYKSGDVVEFKCLRDGRHVMEVGRDYYVQKSDGTATFKRLETIGEEELVFRAINKRKYRDPMPVLRREIVRMAVAEWVMKRAGA